MTASAQIVRGGEGEKLQVLADRIRILVGAEQTGAKYEVFELTGHEGSGPPPHSHPWDEAYFMLDGEVDMFISGTSCRARRGDFLLAPGGATHGFRIVSGSARFLVLTSGSGGGKFFRAMDSEVGFPPASFEAVCAVAIRLGLTLSTESATQKP
ncbi:MAG: cupin domain-containing protein [Betaproteobacteria bacterium]|nr:cupin domain-containing protein [Betaproteobacteria bacterium]